MTKDMAQFVTDATRQWRMVLQAADVARWGDERANAHHRSLERLAAALAAIEAATSASPAEPFPPGPEEDRRG